MIVNPTPTLHKQALHFAGHIGQSKAHYGHYLSLPASENPTIRTADQRQAADVQQAGLKRVLWICEEVSDHD